MYLFAVVQDCHQFLKSYGIADISSAAVSNDLAIGGAVLQSGKAAPTSITMIW